MSALHNKYSYCLNNPLKYTDPSGWVYKNYGAALERLNEINRELCISSYERFCGMKDVIDQMVMARYRAENEEGGAYGGYGGNGLGSNVMLYAQLASFMSNYEASYGPEGSVKDVTLYSLYVPALNFTMFSSSEECFFISGRVNTTLSGPIINSNGEDCENIINVFDISNDVNNTLDYARPDVYSIDVFLAVSALAGGVDIGHSINYITNGKDKGFYPTNSKSKDRVGLEFNLGVSITQYFYINSDSPLNRDALYGDFFKLNLGYKYGGSIILCYNNDNQLVMFGINYSVSGIGGASGGYGKTYQGIW